MQDFKAIEFHFSKIMEALGLDITDPNFIETPKRVSKLYKEIFVGLSENSEKSMEEILTKVFPCTFNEMVVTRNIESWSMCPHHFLPVKLKVDLAYIPDKSVVGLSKMPRIVHLLAAKPSLQEQLTIDIANTIDVMLKPKGVIVRITGEHLCMKMRGVKSNGTDVVTTSFLGCFENLVSRTEFFTAIKS